MNLLNEIRTAFKPVLEGIAPDPGRVPDYIGMIKVAQNAEHGDYQANMAMPLGKLLGKKPQEVAQLIGSKLPTDDLFDAPNVAGPGFINLRLQNTWLAARVREMAGDAHLGIAPTSQPRTFVIDYSSPNVAKPLHVGHLRSTIIGESLKRLLRFLGHQVVGDNHLGDWGTQFGMLLYGYKNHLDAEAYKAEPVRELARLYLLIRSLTKGTADEETDQKKLSPEELAVLNACRDETVKLHQGDPENVRLWREFMPPCLEEVNDIYRRLDVQFEHQHGESFYNPMLPDVVADLKAKGIAKESQGAIVIEEGKQVSLIQKRDGAFTYTTSDLATIRYRVETFKPDALLYVVDFRQSDHFKNLFAAARRWAYGSVELTHVSFGSVLGEDRKPLTTRDGTADELHGLLDQAVAEGARKYQESRSERLTLGKPVPDFTQAEQREIAEIVGLGAVKYADLSQNRTSDYVFSYEKMLATDGNTSTYMQYAYARCRNIFREGNEDPERIRRDPPLVTLVEPEERALTLQLLRFAETLEAAASEYVPHLLTSYLWDLAKAMSSFYASKKCSVLHAGSAELRDSRLLLCDLTARVIQQTLELLGIRTLERM